MKPGLALRVSQHLALTPQLQQSIRLLQLSTLELAQEVDQLLGDNPFLEREEDDLPGADAWSQETAQGLIATQPAVADNPEGAASTEWDAPDAPGAATEVIEAQWEGEGDTSFAPDDAEWGGDAPARGAASAADDEGEDAGGYTAALESLASHLHRQALALRLAPPDRALLGYLIENLNDDGYLEGSLSEHAATLARGDAEAEQDLAERLAPALAWLQSLEPAGVGARDLAECLRLQVAERPVDDAARVALAVLRQPLEWLARRDLKRLASATGASEDELRAAIRLITQLEPKPGRRFADVERNVIVPDVIVRWISGKPGAFARLAVSINPEVMPRLKVHEIYASAMRQHKGEGHAALQQRLQEARWFIKNIQQRFDTILRVSEAIVERQKQFFVHGALAMRPLVLREIADELQLHESTISRVTNAKYMATPQGTFELKYFFGSALGTDTGGNASSTAVRALIRQFVDAESPNKPLSDNQLSDMLREQGIECARRTVAKYREALRIAPANLRKAL